MPVEIRELNIRANVSDQTTVTQDPSAFGQQIEDMKKQIKKECLEELKQFIKDQIER
jgi:hypothetical protein